MRRVYLSIREDIEQVPEHKSSDHRFAQRLDEIYDLHLVHPCEYDLETLTVAASYQYEGPERKRLKQSRHVPEGDLFIIFSDGSNRNRGLDFARREYQFLNQLKSGGRFHNFFNEPECEEMTLKSGLVELSAANDMVAETRDFSLENLEDMIGRYGSVVSKPIFGSQMAGVELFNSPSQVCERGYDVAFLEENHVLQEPLVGDEKRIAIMEGEQLFARIHKDRPNPWKTNGKNIIETYKPADAELEAAKSICEDIGAYLAGIDFIGDKINEVNGSGTGVYFKDAISGRYIDKTPDLVDYIMREFC